MRVVIFFLFMVIATPSFALVAAWDMNNNAGNVLKNALYETATGTGGHRQLRTSGVILPWVVEGTATITIPAGQLATITIPSQLTDCYLSNINISGYGGDAKITVTLPSPHYNRVARINPTNPNATIDFGEGIKILSGTAIVIEIKSTDSEIGQAVDLSWQTAQ
ncbi:MAG: hypothetical protein WC616_01625 [Candidatus Omnitrophota bacterium]